jgi:integrase
MIRFRCNAPNCKKYIKKSDKKCPYCGSNERVYYVVLGNRSFFAGDNLPIAREIETKLKREKRLGQLEYYHMPETITFAQFVKDFYYPYYISKNKSEPRKTNINYFISIFGERDIRSIKQHEIIKALNDITERLNLKPASRNRYLATIKGIFTCAVKSDVIDKHPAKIPAYIEDNTKIRYITEEEEAKIIPICEEKGIKNVVLTALYTGMRRGEIRALTPKNIIDNHIHIKGIDSKTKRGRVIPIHDKISHILADDFSFKGEFDRIFSQICKNLGMEDITFHTLRHTFASRLVMRGVDLYTVSRLLGHESIKTTQRYAHLSPDYFKSAIKKL